MSEEKQENEFLSNIMKHQIDSYLLWLSERSWPLSGLLLFVSVLYVFNFISENQVPLSITSPSVVVALSILLIIVAFVVVFLIVFITFPAAALLLAGAKEKNGNMGFVFFSEGKKTDFILCLLWFLNPFLIGASLIVVGFNDLSKWVSVLLILTVLFASMFVLMMRMRTVGLQHASSLRFSKIFLSSILPVSFQFVVVVFLFFVVASFSYAANNWVLFVCYFLLCVATGVIQVLAAKYIAKSFHSENYLKKSMAFIAFVVFVLGFYPPSGAFLVERVFQMTSSGARDCVVMSWNTENPEISPEIRLSNGSGLSEESVPLRILIEADGYFFVRAHERDKKDEPVYFIPRILVSGMKNCPSGYADKANLVG